MIGTKFAWKRLENICHENQYPFHQCFDSLDKKTNPNHSIHKHEANPNANDHKAAPEIHSKVWVFNKKFQNWKHTCKAFQGKKFIPSPS